MNDNTAAKTFEVASIYLQAATLGWHVDTLSPCLSCGACCARFRVSYYWGEAVPEGYYTETTPMFRSLKSTNDSEGRPRCDALTGAIGEAVACGIYSERPSPCHNFKHSYEDGGPHEPRCDEARSKFGLVPLLKP
jgi:Fe-S-cluster containining protein